jgi:hypothetical protein
MGWTSLGPVIVSGAQVENIIEESGIHPRHLP